MSAARPDWPAEVTYSAGMVVHNILNSPSVLKKIKEFTPKLLTSSFFSRYASQTERPQLCISRRGHHFSSWRR